MNKKLKPVIIAAGIVIVVAFAAFFLYAAKLYPIAIVNGRIIGVKEYNSSLSVSESYLSRLLEANSANMNESDKQTFLKEMRKSALKNLVEEQLIKEYLEKNMDKKELQSVVRNKINDVLEEKDENFTDGVSTLYGLNMADFINLILYPKAEREIIEGKFFLAEQDFSVWFNKAKKEAKVSIFIPEFVWKDGGVADK